VKVEIDTGRSRSLAKLIGSLFAPSTSLAEEKKVSVR
jgi:hypothetical protein